METGRRQLGHLFSILGSAGVIVSLWAPWYTFRIPTLAIERAEQLAPRFGSFGPIINQAAELARHLGPLQVDSWRLLTVGPALLLVVSVVAGGLSLLAAGDRASGVGRIVSAAGLVGIAITLYRVIKPPDSGTGILHPAWGLELALASTVVVVVGGLLAAAGERDAAAAGADHGSGVFAR